MRRGLQVIDAVYEKGSSIYLQLWTAVLAKEDNSPYVSASPIPKPESKDVPRTLTTDEIKEYIGAYATASKTPFEH